MTTEAAALAEEPDSEVPAQAAPRSATTHAARPLLAVLRRAFVDAAPAWGGAAALAWFGGILLGGAAVAGWIGSDDAFSDFGRAAGFGRPTLDVLAPLFGAVLGATALAPGARFLLVAAQPRLTPATAALALAAGRAGAAAAGVLLGTFAAFALLAATGSSVPATPALAVAVAGAFCVLAFAMLGLVAAAAAGPERAGAALAAAVALVVVTGPLWDTAIYAGALKSVGLRGLQGGDLPAWVLVAQGLNPLTAYKAMMATWDSSLANAVESAAMRAGLPEYANPWTFGALLVAWAISAASLAAYVVRRRDS